VKSSSCGFINGKSSCTKAKSIPIWIKDQNITIGISCNKLSIIIGDLLIDDSLLSDKSVSEKAAKISVIEDVPGSLKAIFRKLAYRAIDCGVYDSVIVDGRDSGTNLFPETKFKFFLDADFNSRAERRFYQYPHRYDFDLNKANESMKVRSEYDNARLTKKDDKSFYLGYIDSTNLSADVVADLIILNCLKKEDEK